jgi:hypothetical protein
VIYPIKKFRRAIMTEKKISRRDAMKMLGVAVGAATLSTLPSKWNTPELAAGVLPAHARQSAVFTQIIRTATVNGAIAGDDTFRYFAFNEGPITDAQILASPITTLTISWGGDNPPPGVSGGAGFYLAQGNLIQADIMMYLAPGVSTSPVSSNDSGCWTGNRPYNGLDIVKGKLPDWNLTTVTVVLS